MRIGTESDLQALKEYWLPSRRFGGRNRGRPSTLERGYGNREAEIIWLPSPRGVRGLGVVWRTGQAFDELGSFRVSASNQHSGSLLHRLCGGEGLGKSRQQ